MSQERNLTQGPEPVDTADLHFKSLSKLKVLDRSELSFDSNLSLLAVSQYYGLVFIGKNNGFLILKSKEVFSASTSNGYHKKEIVFNSKTSHLAVNFEQKLLAVGCQSKMGPIVYIYNITSFLTKGVSPMKTVPLSKPFQDPVIQLCEVMWQPNNFNGLTLCFSDGSVSSLSLSQATGNDIFSLPNTTQARCCCWSPKGKQIVIGCSDGTLSQYKPDLKFIKKLPAPPLFNGAVSVVNVLWISSFQFAAAYKEQHKPEEYPVIVIVNAQKNEPVKFINYDDITYSSSFFRNHQLYFCHQSAWNTIFVASANSIEVTVLHGKEDNSIWEQWLLGDASRAELPLNADKVETVPVGIAIDYTSDQTVPWGEDSLPPAPRLLLLSSEGLLTTFNVINLCKGDPQLTHPPEETFEDSWFKMEGNNDLLSLSKMNQPSMSTFVSQTSSLENIKPAQTLPPASAFPPPVSASLLTNKLFTSGSSGFTVQPSKEQVVFSSQPVTLDRQPESEAQQPLKTSIVPISSNHNSSLKWSQNPSNLFSFNIVTSGGIQNSQTFSNKDKEIAKNEQNLNVFTSSTIAAKEPIKFMNMKENLGIIKEPANVIKSSESTDAVKTTSSTVLIGGQNTPLSTVPTMNAEQKLANKKFEASPSRSSAELLAVSSKIYVTALVDEIDHFDAELRDVLSRVSALRVHIGTGEEKLDLRKSIEKLNDLEKSLHNNISSQKNEIHSIKSDVIEAFAWLEDARSRNRQRKSRTYIELKKSEDLDPMSSRVLSEISHLKYYIENQLKQLHSYLMREWMEHENNCRLDTKSMMIVPSMEELYKTMHLELKILNKLRATVEELRQRVIQKNMKIRSQTALITEYVDCYPKPVDESSRMSELYKLADNLLQIKIDRDEPEDYINMTDAFQLMIKNQINEISERSKKLTVFKQNILRDTFCEREMMKTRSVKSKFGTSSFIRNSSRIYTKYYNNLKDSDTEDTIKSGGNELEVEIDTTNPKLPHSNFQRQEKIIISVKRNNESKVDLKETPVSSETNTLVSVNKELSKLVSDIGSSLQEKLEIGKPTELSLIEQTAAGDTPSPLTETSKSELKTAPFVFNAAPVFSFGISGLQSSNVPIITSGLGSSTGNMQTNGVPSASNTAPVFALKAADVTSTTSTTNSFSFPTVKTSSFSPKTYTPFSSSAPETPANTSESSSPSSSDIKISAINTTTTPVFSFSSNTSSAPISSTVTTASMSVFKFTTSSSSIFKFTTSASSFSFPSSINSSKTNSGGTTFSFTSQTLPTAIVSITSSDISPGTSTVNVLSQSNLTFKGFAEANKEVNLEKTGTQFGLTELDSGPTLTIATTPTTTTITNVTASTASNVTHANTAVIASHDSPINEGKSESESKKCEAKEDEEQNSDGKINLTVPETESSDPEKTEASSIALPEFVQQSTTPVFTESTVVTTTISTASFSSTPSTTSTLSFGVPGKSIFSQSMPVSTTASIFSSAKPIASNSELFNATPSIPASSSNIFGLSSAVSTTAGSSPFSQTVPTTSNTSSFVQPSKDELGQTATLFSDMLRSGLSSGSVFETSSANASGNIFDKSGSSIFGNARTSVTSATATTGLFENTSSNIFMKSSFGQIPSSSSSNFFAQPQRESTTFFGQNICSSFGSTTTTAPNQSPFASGFNSRPVFGQSLFGQSNAGSSTTNIFGNSSSASSGGNIFQMGSSSFSNTTPAPFSSGQSTSPATSAFQKPMGGFGGSPVFGSGLATTGTFGAPPTFGGASTFGSPPSFGSSQKIFGSPQGTFGQNQSNFESLANESTVGFADLAQRNQSQTFGGSTFNQSATFESESSFGGKSFSSWRS